MNQYGFFTKNGVLISYRGFETELTIPGEVTKIGDNAFQNHALVEYVTIPETVKTIGFYSFSGCVNLKGVTIPESIRKIPKHVFDNCPNLKEMTYHGVKFTWNPKKENPQEVWKAIDSNEIPAENNWSVALKNSVLWGMFCKNPKNEDVLAQIKKNFVKLFKYLIDQNDIATAEKVVKESKLINKRNLESIVKYADEKQAEAFQKLLATGKED